MTDEIKRAEKIRSAIKALQNKHGQLSPAIVLRAARNAKHPLHDEFIWDDKKAALEQRLERARELIRYVTVVTIDRSRKIVSPYYVRDPMQKASEQGMIALTSDLLDRANAEKILVAELDRCESAIKRARSIAGVLDKAHKGLAARLERMLSNVIATRELITDKAA